MNEAFEKWWKTNGIEQATYTEKSAAKKGFRAGMLAAADLLAQRLYKTQDECERAIREAAKS